MAWLSYRLQIFKFSAMANMLILFYLFCDGKLEDNLVGIFNLFDADGNKVFENNNSLSI